MLKDLPKIVLVTDVPLSKEGGGINRTLVNLLTDYPAERFLLYAPQDALQANPPVEPFAQQAIGFPIRFPLRISNRLAKWIDPLVRLINFELMAWLPIPHQKQIQAFAPDLILVCAHSLSAILLGYRLTQQINCPYLIYAMDDWTNDANRRWFTGNGRDLLYKLLKDAAGWLVISEELKDSFSQYFHLAPERIMIVHNPVDLSDRKPPNLKVQTTGTFKIVYAGSIWQMHYDGLAAVAQAVYEMRQEGYDVELILHTEPGFWECYKSEWQSWEVTYGGLIPYSQLNHFLQQADLLLVTSSFLSEFELFTRSSLQTKVTDYMAAGRPILCCGPSYSVCNNFVKKWNCGLVVETNCIPEIKNFLVKQLKNRIPNQIYAQIAFDTLKEHFEKTKVSARLFEFLGTMKC
jgi:glycosyltransferase involved in cell wall biosynthesis